MAGSIGIDQNHFFEYPIQSGIKMGQETQPGKTLTMITRYV
jgi:hypothetical protein